MKLAKKMSAIMLVMLMALTMSVTAFAEGTDYSITINNPVDKHTYEAYQIFAGDLHDGVLSNITWGTGITDEGKTALGDATEKAEALTDANAKEFADEVAKYLSTTCASTNTLTEDGYVISGLDEGYYLVKDKDGSLAGADDSYTSYILQVLGNVSMEPKSDKPTSQKKVKDINDSKETTKTDWQDSADHDIGDRIDFQLKGTVASNYDSYKTYYYAFHDKECNGLTFDPTSVKVYVDGTLVTANYEVVTEGIEDGCTFEVVFSDLKKIEEVKADSVITVEYQSVLNDNAVLGSAGNPNESYLEYSNNPNSTQGGSDSGDDGTGGGTGGGGGDDDDDDDEEETGNTPWDKVIVFTYKTVVNKVDPDNNPLTGAEFTLEKYNKTTDVWNAVAVVLNDAGTVFTFNGIDDGQYRITETKAPVGYNKIDPIYFEVTAEHDVESDNPALTALSATQKKPDGSDLVSGVVATFTARKTDGSLSTDVVNYGGATLPSTGGVGTTLFYVLGTILVLGAIVSFIVKKRLSNQA